MSNYIFTGRFQPLHLGHIKFLESFKKEHPDDLLIICIIRNTTEKNLDPKEKSGFYFESIKKQRIENNPLPNWNRYMLLKIAIESNELLKNNTIIFFRNRSDLNWDLSVSDLPKDRIWLLPSYEKEKFDEEKYKYYISKNERIELISVDYNCNYSGEVIRNLLKSNHTDLSFLPFECREYFKKECLGYFI